MQVLTKFCCFGQSMDFADNPKYVKRVTILPAFVHFFAHAKPVASWRIPSCKDSAYTEVHALACCAMLLAGGMGLLSGSQCESGEL